MRANSPAEPCLIHGALALAVLASLVVAAEAAEGADLELTVPQQALVFADILMPLAVHGQLDAVNRLDDEECWDAYDADRDGTWVRIGLLACGPAGERLEIPVFAARATPDARCTWWVRWMPTRPGLWTLTAHGEAAIRGTRMQGDSPACTVQVAAGTLTGSLIAPGPGDDPRWIRTRQTDGSSSPSWLFGACRAWDVADDPAGGGPWSTCEHIDRDRDLLPALRENGFNLLNQWMAPWEFLLVHCDEAEHWRQADGSWKRRPLPPTSPSRAWIHLDQGRAAAFDEQVRACEGAPGQASVHLLLSILPHQVFQMASHEWGRNESGWSPEDDHGRQPLDHLNGFSRFPLASAWDFFTADPAAPISDPRARLFDAQANLFRYAIARWSPSRALGAWVVIDELDGVGDEHGLLATKTGWWAHAQCDRWHANLVHLLRGTLVRSDGLVYAGDPYRHPISSATTSFITGIEPGANIEWDGGPGLPRPDLIGWHWYPEWPDGSSYAKAWDTTVQGILAYSRRQVPGAHLISEFGVPDRSAPGDEASRLYPTLYHLAIWSAILSGQAGTPMNWNDGKEFGELRPRHEPGPFDAAHYGIDNARQLQALLAFLGDRTPGDWTTCAPPDQVQLAGAGAVRATALRRRIGPLELLGWTFAPSGAGTMTITGLPEGSYHLRWFDTWEGRYLPEPSVLLTAPAAGTLSVSLDGALARTAGQAVFPTTTREQRGRDIAFRITSDPH